MAVIELGMWAAIGSDQEDTPGWETALMGSSPAGSSPSFGKLVEQGPLEDQLERAIYVSQQGVQAVEMTEAQFIMHTNYVIMRYLKRLHRAAFSHAKPVDSYQATPQGDFTNAVSQLQPIQLQPSYHTEEMIQSILYSIPVGTTLAVLKLGDRYLELYNGAALATPLVNSLGYLRLMLAQDDDRFLYLQPAPTHAPHIELMGYAYEYYGDS